LYERFCFTFLLCFFYCLFCDTEGIRDTSDVGFCLFGFPSLFWALPELRAC